MFSNILIAIDDSEQLPSILSLAADLVEKHRPKVNIVYVLELDYSLPDKKTEIEYPQAIYEQEAAELLISKATSILNAAQHHDITGKVLTGFPAQEIVTEARRLNCDLIIIGHRHLSRLEKLLEPSVGSYVIEKSPCPVLIEVRHSAL
ncbi:universal stress protein [Pseudomonas aeruginosa]|uniref:universal stress protein n=1 Tax=Pseudomonas aeruginosa TaxID=287 RepID=UPI0009A41E5C|nr:universal stress protein [Pseudomonas aeruginosa]WNP71130.1 universal stress protein [Pseudomonas aeruginosa]HBN9524571.1 universal stress protein [Pseudomonas aeruginosa]HBP1137360.1 universal stress protein [Pseudomonas aeruginosa]